MRADVFPIPDVPCGRLAIMPRPRAGDWLPGEIESWRRSGLDTIVSLLEESEIAELGLEQEAVLCAQAGILFIHFPVPDRGVPAAREEAAVLIGSLVKQLREGRGVGIHCRIGIGRSALVAVCILIALGHPAESAWTSVETARGISVPDTTEQREWGNRFAV